MESIEEEFHTDNVDSEGNIFEVNVRVFSNILHRGSIDNLHSNTRIVRRPMDEENILHRSHLSSNIRHHEQDETKINFGPETNESKLCQIQHLLLRHLWN